MTEIVLWDDPPAMCAGTPTPAMSICEDRLVAAYVCHNPEFPGWDPTYSIEHPGFDRYSALLEFSGVTRHSLGLPNDETLPTHPLYSFGLRPYEFIEVINHSAGKSGDRRWIVTFHDETLDVMESKPESLRRGLKARIRNRLSLWLPNFRPPQRPLVACAVIRRRFPSG